MDYLKKLIGILGIVALVFPFGCATSGTSSGGSGSGSSVNVDNPAQTLADYLRRVSGVTVQGSGDNVRVYVRGVSSSAGNNEPLFIVDGSRAGRSYQDVVNRVDVNDIDRIRVIKGSEAGTRYGLEGSNGVIEIRTKRD